MPRPPLDIDLLFTYHPPKGDQAERYQRITVAAKAFAEVLVDCCPVSAEFTIAIQKLQEARMTANSAIALNE